jgi:hypothetical protein
MLIIFLIFFQQVKIGSKEWVISTIENSIFGIANFFRIICLLFVLSALFQIGLSKGDVETLAKAKRNLAVGLIGFLVLSALSNFYNYIRGISQTI